jgi:hypothetical protein
MQGKQPNPYTDTQTELTAEGAIQVLLDWDHGDDITNRAMVEIVRLVINTAWRACNTHAMNSVWMRKMLFDMAMHQNACNPNDTPASRPRHILWDQVADLFIHQSKMQNQNVYKLSIRASFLADFAYIVKESMATPYIHGASIPRGMRGWLDDELQKLGKATTELIYDLLPELRHQVTYNYGSTMPDVAERLRNMDITSHTGVDMDTEEDPDDPKIFRLPGGRKIM